MKRKNNVKWSYPSKIVLEKNCGSDDWYHLTRECSCGEHSEYIASSKDMKVIKKAFEKELDKDKYDVTIDFT